MNLAEKLVENGELSKEEYIRLLEQAGDGEIRAYLTNEAVKLRKKYYGSEVFVRGLIEFSNYCKNNCYYCGIRRDNRHVNRYRLTKEEMLECCSVGYNLDFRTFVLQGGEDPWYTDERMADIVRSIKEKYPDCAITLSIGERSRESYRLFREAGADRYLLRHETASQEHYEKLHPKEMSLAVRKQCLRDLKELGYQTGAGFMVGSPWQTEADLAEDLVFLKELQPHMVGIGPFIPHHDTPFKDKAPGTLEMTLFLLSVIRIILPAANLPSTTALGTIHPKGRELGILAGANVVMPNLSPTGVRKQYELYDNKICTGDEAAECRYCLQRRIESIGYRLVCARGDAAEI